MKKKIKLLAVLVCLVFIAASLIVCDKNEENNENNDISQISGSTNTPEIAPEKTPETTPEATPDAAPESTPVALDDGTESTTKKNETLPEDTSKSNPEESPKAVPEPGTGASSQTPDALTSETPQEPVKNEVTADEIAGAFAGSIYTNEYFGFTAEFPQDWFIASKDELTAYNQLGVEFVKQINSNDKSVDMTAAQMIPLFLASKHPLDYAQGINPYINAIAQNLGIAASFISDPKDYVTIALQGMKLQELDFTMGEAENLKIGGKDFAKVDLVIKINGVGVPQTMYATLADSYAVILSFTYSSDEDRKHLEEIINTVSFK